MHAQQLQPGAVCAPQRENVSLQRFAQVQQSEGGVVDADGGVDGGGRHVLALPSARHHRGELLQEEVGLIPQCRRQRQPGAQVTQDLPHLGQRLVGTGALDDASPGGCVQQRRAGAHPRVLGADPHARGAAVHAVE